MHTPEDRLPADARLDAPGPAALAAAPAPNVPTPGVSMGVTRIPTMPTLPDLDPATLALVMAQMAGEMFATPGSVAPASAGSPSTATPATSAPAPPAASAVPAVHTPAGGASPPSAPALAPAPAP